MSGGILNMYNSDTYPAVGSDLRGSYNTFLSQGCSLLVSSASSVPENISIDATRFDGILVVDSQTEVVPANGVLEVDLCSLDGTNVYGQVRVSSENRASVVYSVVRRGVSDSYRFSTPLR